jgi:hypothetical protein
MKKLKKNGRGDNIYTVRAKKKMPSRIAVKKKVFK